MELEGSLSISSGDTAAGPMAGGAGHWTLSVLGVSLASLC